MREYRLIILALAVALAGCTGTMRIPNTEQGTRVDVGGKTILVTQYGGSWYAAHADYLPNNLVVPESEFLPRKMAFIEAIEATSKCKVIDSVLSFGAASIQASVKC